MFLTPSEITVLTGYKRKAEQSAWLRRHGISHWRNRNGDIVVLRSSLDPDAKLPDRPTKVFDFGPQA